MADHDEADLDRKRRTRRSVLQGAALAGLSAPVLAACGSSGNESGGTTKTSSSGKLAKTTDVPVGSGIIVGDTNAGTIITQPAKGTFKGFVNMCKHAGCPLGSVTTTINCNCHGSEYSIKDGSPVRGPNGQPATTITALDPRQLTVKGTEISTP